MISHYHGSIDSLLFLKPVVIILSILMFHACVSIAQENNLEGYKKCKNNFVCGSLVNVGYPFWGIHHTDGGKSRPEYCGLPYYKLDCYDGDIAEIQISEESYRVLVIDTKSKVMNITNKKFMDDDDACPSKYPVAKFGSSSFVPPDVDTLSLFFDCSISSDIDNLDEFKFNCLINNNRLSSDGYWHIGISTLFSSSCKNRVDVPVMPAALRDLTTGAVPAIIKQGFSVPYLSSVSVTTTINMCETCQSSGGACGYNITTEAPACLCGPGGSRGR
ncbi:hypothetical protein MKW98_005571 [Papaver atlanticum]|uniref:Uncharacterized protein n=1 Tax=Papaver atlanticum TaxID=357466 RepID=A0AAD4XIJ0_9MAGN|nr:hypothetical protein MKW98_005571 [Papaver atlanticum]